MCMQGFASGPLGLVFLGIVIVATPAIEVARVTKKGASKLGSGISKAAEAVDSVVHRTLLQRKIDRLSQRLLVLRNDPVLLHRRAVLYFLMHKLQDARRDALAAIEHTTEEHQEHQWEFHHLAGQVFDGLGEYQNAVAYFNKAVQLFPTTTQAKAAGAVSNSADSSKKSKSFSSFVRGFSDRMSDAYNDVRIKIDEKRHKESDVDEISRKQIAQFMKYKYSLPEVLNNRGLAHLHASFYEEARKDFQSALEQCEAQLDGPLTGVAAAAAAAAAVGTDDNVDKNTQRSILINLGVMLRYHIALTHYYTHDITAAIDMFTQAFNYNNTHHAQFGAQILMMRAACYARRGVSDATNADIQKVQESLPSVSEPQLHYRLLEDGLIVNEILTFFAPKSQAMGNCAQANRHLSKLVEQRRRDQEVLEEQFRSYE